MKSATRGIISCEGLFENEGVRNCIRCKSGVSGESKDTPKIKDIKLKRCRAQGVSLKIFFKTGDIGITND